MIIAHHDDPRGQGPGALDRVTSDAGQDLVGGPDPDKLGRRLGQGRRGASRDPGSRDVLEDRHAVLAPRDVDREGGAHDLPLGTVRAGKDAGEWISRIAERTASPFGEAGQRERTLRGWDAVQEIPAAQLFKRHAQHLASGRIGIDETPLGIDDGDPLLDTGHHCGQRRQTQRGGVN